MEKVSVVIPCYNSGKTIKKTISSLKNQTWDNIEIIVVNDGSDDPYTLEIISKLKNVKVIKKVNGGLSSARNTGINHSKGNYILFLDSDDWVDVNVVEKMMEKIKKSNRDFVFCDMKLEGEKKNIRRKHYNFFEQLFINHISYFILIKKSLIKKIGLYDENMKLGYEDWELNIRLGKEGYYPERLEFPLFHYNVTTSGMLNSVSKKNHDVIYDYIRKKHKNLFKIKTILKTYIFWRKKKMNYSIFLYVFLYLCISVFPGKKFAKIYNTIYFLKTFFYK